MHSDTVEDNDLKPLQEGGVGQGLGRRGVDPPIGVRGAARGGEKVVWALHKVPEEGRILRKTIR